MARSVVRAILVATVVAALIGFGRPVAAQRPNIDDLLDRLGTYILDYEQKLSALVAEERYEQKLVTRTTGLSRETESYTDSRSTRRVLTSDYVMLRLPGGQPWSGFRDTFLVDGQPVRQREGRLEHFLVDGSDDGLEQATRIAEENAVFNLGSDLVYRTINVPMVVLDLLHPRFRSHFTFRGRGRETVDGRQVWKIDFLERARPSLIRTPAGVDQITRGSAWVDPSTGAVIRTYLNVIVSPASQAKITVEYRIDTRLAFLVPSTMRETYERFSSDIKTTATYSNFRQFQTGARILDGAR